MLFQRRFHEGIRSGAIACTVRIWQSPRVKAGGRYSLGEGAVVVDKIRETSLDELTPALARRCGFPSLVDLLQTAKHGAGERVFVIEFHYDARRGGHAKRGTAPASAEEIAELVQRLDAMDRRSKAGPWTLRTLRAIEARPGVLAAKLASSLGRPRDEFKRDVRKLKALGLTSSLEIGYRLTAKAESLLASLARGSGA